VVVVMVVGHCGDEVGGGGGGDETWLRLNEAFCDEWVWRLIIRC